MSSYLAWSPSLSSFWLSLSLILLYVGILLIFAEAFKRISAKNGELTRKIVHIGSGNVILLAWWLKIPASVGMGASAIASLIAVISYYVPILPSINSVGRKSWGTFFYAVSVGLLIGWFWPLQQPHYAAIGILVMAWGDGLAAIIGQNFGKHPYQLLGIQKSWEGSLTMMGVSFLVSGSILLGTQGNLWQTWEVALGVALVATLLEMVSKLGVDNLTVPLGSAAVAFYLNHLFLTSF
jgi:phytol kinase